MTCIRMSFIYNSCNSNVAGTYEHVCMGEGYLAEIPSSLKLYFSELFTV